MFKLRFDGIKYNKLKLKFFVLTSSYILNMAEWAELGRIHAIITGTVHSQSELIFFLKKYSDEKYSEGSRGAAAQNVTVKLTGCRFNAHSTRLNIYLNLYFHFFALVSRQSMALSTATQYAMPPESSRKWRTECLNTSIAPPVGYSVKLMKYS